MKQHILYILGLCLCLVACHKDDPENGGEKGPFGRTVLVYMAMQNSLGSEGYHRADSTEIANAMGFIPENDRLLLFIDDVQKPRIYELSRALNATDKKTGRPIGPKLVKTWKTEQSSASPEMLTEVLKYMRTDYPADSYGLVLGSHANGWLPTEQTPQGASQHRAPRKTWGIDVGPEGSMRNDLGVAGSIPDQMEITELASAISKSGVHPEYILFDACLMQNIEVDYALRHVTNYIIGSPIAISAEGAYYTDLVHYGLFSSADDVCSAYVNYYLGHGSIPYRDNYGTVMSCVKTAGLENLAHEMHSLLEMLFPGKNAEEKVEALKAKPLKGALNYQAYAKSYYYRPHNYDIISAVKAMGADLLLAFQLQKALDDVVTAKGANATFYIGPGYFTMQTMPTSEKDWYGVSMFVPQQEYTDYASLCIFGDLNEEFKKTEWYKAVY